MGPKHKRHGPEPTVSPLNSKDSLFNKFTERDKNYISNNNECQRPRDRKKKVTTTTSANNLENKMNNRNGVFHNNKDAAISKTIPNTTQYKIIESQLKFTVTIG